MKRHTYPAKVAHNPREALNRQLPGTPARLVNNRLIIGGQPFEYFKGVMNAVLRGAF